MRWRFERDKGGKQIEVRAAEGSWRFGEWLRNVVCPGILQSVTRTLHRSVVQTAGGRREQQGARTSRAARTLPLVVQTSGSIRVRIARVGVGCWTGRRGCVVKKVLSSAK